MRDMLSLIGNTPLVSLGDVKIKLEYYNPTGSHKDRTALYMVNDAKSRVAAGSFMVEYTSGNTGISVAFVSKLMGFRSIILVPEKISKAKINFMKFLGAEVILVKEDEDGHKLAENIAKERGGIFLNQGENLANFKAHYETTAPEIIRDAPDVRCLVMGVGTGGTVYGVGKYLKDEIENVKVYALIPKNSYAEEVLLGRRSDDRQILEGFSYHRVNKLFERALNEGVIDEIFVVGADEALKGVKILAREGIIGGPTSGANYYYAAKLSKNCGKTVTIAADTILRYPHILDEL